MSVKQNLFVSIFVLKCLMMLNDVEYKTFKMFVTQMSNYPFVISFQQDIIRSKIAWLKMSEKHMSFTGLQIRSWSSYCENKCILLIVRSWAFHWYINFYNFIYFMLHFVINNTPQMWQVV